MQKIGFGGGCHWCTEAIFLSLRGVITVEQGWIAPAGNKQRFSEAVIISFDTKIIALETLIAVHLHTHSSTAMHSMREKYRSAVYTFNGRQQLAAGKAVKALQPGFAAPIITEVLPFGNFRLNRNEYLNYYYNGKEKLFCQNVINPKLRLLLAQFSGVADKDKLAHLEQGDL